MQTHLYLIRLICTEHIKEVWTKDKWPLTSRRSCHSASRASITSVGRHAPSKARLHMCIWRWGHCSWWPASHKAAGVRHTESPRFEVMIICHSPPSFCRPPEGLYIRQSASSLATWSQIPSLYTRHLLCPENEWWEAWSDSLHCVPRAPSLNGNEPSSSHPTVFSSPEGNCSSLHNI